MQHSNLPYYSCLGCEPEKVFLQLYWNWIPSLIRKTESFNIGFVHLILSPSIANWFLQHVLSAAVRFWCGYDTYTLLTMVE